VGVGVVSWLATLVNFVLLVVYYGYQRVWLQAMTSDIPSNSFEQPNVEYHDFTVDFNGRNEYEILSVGVVLMVLDTAALAFQLAATLLKWKTKILVGIVRVLSLALAPCIESSS